jgi:hypothetical protein
MPRLLSFTETLRRLPVISPRRSMPACLAICATLIGMSATGRADAAAALSGPEPIVLPEGLAVAPGAGLDFTYQIVPWYDQSKKVLASWSGEQLQYIVSVDRMPAGSPGAEQYFEGLKRDLTSLSSEPIKVTNSGAYDAVGGLKGHYIEVQWTPRGSPKETGQVVHFISDGQVSFLGFATLVKGVTPEQMRSESVRLFQTASLASHESAPVEPAQSNETPFVGRWSAGEALPDGRQVSSILELKPDLTFATEVSVDGRRIFSGSGVWEIQDRTLRTTYGHSMPPLPDDLRTDADDIESFDGKTLSMINHRSGQRHTFARSL